MSTLYASFTNPSDAERAAGALLDQGARKEDLTIITNENYHTIRNEAGAQSVSDTEHAAKEGLSTTTAEDAGAGAVKGAAIGAGLGVVAALTAMLVPGVGLVLGGGALAMALSGAAATTAAGALAGGVTGYLVDQGVESVHITHYSNAIQHGGAIIAITVPSENLTLLEAENVLSKYGASNISTTYTERRIDGTPVVTPTQPKVIVNTLLPTTMIVDPQLVQEANARALNLTPDEEVVLHYTVVTNAETGERTNFLTEFRPVDIDPMTGEVHQATVIDPITGERTVKTFAIAPGVHTSAEMLRDVQIIERNRRPYMS